MIKQDVEFLAAGERPLALHSASCTLNCTEPPIVGPIASNPGHMHTPAAADSDVAPIWADIDVHRGPWRQGRARGSAMGARPRPRAPTQHDTAGSMAPVLGALGAQIVMAEALGAPAPALNVGAARSDGGPGGHVPNGIPLRLRAGYRH